MEEATVDCLIDEGTRTWNEAMVDGIFAPQEAEEIKNILLASIETEDTMYWSWEHDGRYSCKTGYRFLKEDEVGFQVEENQDHEKELWKKIWALECPNKVRNLIWRACRNSLPSKCNLMRQTIISEQSCDRCKGENEDVLHVVWSCKELDEVWGANTVWNFRNHKCFSNFSELLAWVFDHQRNPVLFSFTIWSIWHQRNQVRTQPSHRPLNLISQWAHDRFVEFNDLKTAPTTSRPWRQVWWKPPDQGAFKINFDRAIFIGNNCSGLRVVVHDKEGLAIASMATRVPQQLQPIEIEALAAYKAIVFAKELGLSQVVLEGDSSTVMSALNSSNPRLAPFGLPVQDTLNVATDFSKLSYSHTKREGNFVAHNLAQLAANILNCVIWMEDIPTDVMSFYHANLADIP